MSLKLGAVLIFTLGAFTAFEAKMIAVTSREIGNRIDDESSESRGSERINLSMPGIEVTGKIVQNPVEAMKISFFFAH